MTPSGQRTSPGPGSGPLRASASASARNRARSAAAALSCSRRVVLGSTAGCVDRAARSGAGRAARWMTSVSGVASSAVSGPVTAEGAPGRNTARFMPLPSRPRPASRSPPSRPLPAPAGRCGNRLRRGPERPRPASTSPDATSSPARQAAQYRLLLRCSRARASCEPREGLQTVARAVSASSLTRRRRRQEARRGQQRQRRRHRHGSAPLRSGAAAAAADGPRRRPGRSARRCRSAARRQNTARSTGAPRSHSLSSGPLVGRDSQNHNRKRAPGLMPWPPVACTIVSAPRNATGKARSTAAAQAARSRGSQPGGKGRPSTSSAAQRRGDSRSVGASPVWDRGAAADARPPSAPGPQ